MTLKDEGFRYLVSPDLRIWNWIHPAEVEQRKQLGWTDCTDMSDAKLDAFISGQPCEE